MFHQSLIHRLAVFLFFDSLFLSMRLALAFRPRIHLPALRRGVGSMEIKRYGSLNPTARTCLTMVSSFSSTISRHTPVPRAAVSVVVRHHGDKRKEPTFLLVQRGSPPNVGIWSVPGGKIELGEKTLEAAKRELTEEVKFRNQDDEGVALAWYSETFCTSDAIVEGDEDTGKTSFHYVIAQTFAEVVDNHNYPEPPQVESADDAQAAKWWTLEEMKRAEKDKKILPNLVRVIQRAESLYQYGMLPASHTMNIPNAP